ncbi:Leucine-, isoleucine-, valine-, threonine-, and alanine-binding protein [subsurface metagenome]
MIKKVILAFAALLLVLPAAACGPAPAEEIKIGAIMDITGALSGIGSIIRDGAVLAVKEINEAGGINGKQVKLIVEDGATDTTTGFEAVKKLVEVNGCKVIIGPMISPAVIASGPYVAERGVVIVSPSATSPEITDQDWRQFVFRTCTSDILQGEAMTQLIIEKGYKKVATLVVDNTYGAGIEEVAKEKLAGKAEIVATIKYDLAKLDYLTELQIIKDRNPDAIIHVGYHDDAQIMYKQALQLGLDNILWVAAEGVYSDYTLEMVEAAEFMEKAVIGTSPIAPEGLSTFEEFAAAYEADFGIPPGVYADTVYDATKMVALAIEQGGYDGAKISEALLEIGHNYPGVSGTITFSPVGDRISGDFEVWKVVKEAGEYKYERVKVISL